MAVVKPAHDPASSLNVALRVLPRDLKNDLELPAPFDQRARMIAPLEHPAIVPVDEYIGHNRQWTV
jgi:hypothetical protein